MTTLLVIAIIWASLSAYLGVSGIVYAQLLRSWVPKKCSRSEPHLISDCRRCNHRCWSVAAGLLWPFAAPFVVTLALSTRRERKATRIAELERELLDLDGKP